MRVRGVIEGFYGPPWTHAERLDLLAFCGRHALNTWVHAPKDDPYHRERWRDPYPDDELARFADLVGAAGRSGVEFFYAIAPGLSVCYSDDRELAALEEKLEQLRGAGVRTFHLLWDDVEHELRCAGDVDRFGSEPSPSAAAQAFLSNRVGLPVVCPMGYAGNGPTPYRETLRALLDPQITVYWTGPEVVSRSITREDLDAASGAFGHELLLWDNYPVNDFDRARLFLGPLRGRDARLAGGRLLGIVTNGMLQAVPSKLPLATIADFAVDPDAHDPIASLEGALRAYGAEVADALAVPPAPIEAPTDVVALAEALAPGVDAPTAVALLEPFV